MGVDLGTTRVKAALFDFTGGVPRLVGTDDEAVSLERSAPGRAEMDPEAVVRCASRAIHGAMLPAGAGFPEAIGFSGAMHSLLPLDAAGSPLGPAITWADQRSAPQAEALRADAEAADIQRRTGTPLQAMSVLSKLLWMRDNGKLRGVHRFVGLKEYVMAVWAGVPCDFMDRSMASATGLYSGDGWDEALLDRIGLSADRLPRVVEPTDFVAPRMVAGAGDGPLSNLGCGAIEEGRAALTIGTSGAVRVRSGSVNAAAEAFRYYLADGMWISGGAISNGGALVDWATGAYGFRDVDALLEAAAQSPVGADGVVMLPYLAGERWDAGACGLVFGLRTHSGRTHLARAALEATGLALRDVVEMLPPISEAAATGGFTRSPLWMQAVADATGLTLRRSRVEEAAALGAAMLAARACGILPELTSCASRVWEDVEGIVEPSPPARRTMDDRFALYRRLYAATRPLVEP